MSLVSTKLGRLLKIHENAVLKGRILSACEASSADLKKEVVRLGGDPSGKSVAQLMDQLAHLYWDVEAPGQEFPEQIDPMLAKGISTLDPDEIRRLFTKEGYFIEEKKDGMRSVLSISASGQVTMTSRSRSVKNYRFTPHQENVLGFQGIKSPFNGRTVLDGELMSPKAIVDTGGTVTAGSLQAVVALVHMNPEESLKIQREIGSLKYVCYDILFFNGTDVQALPFEKREELANTAVIMLKEANPDMPIEKNVTIKDYDDAYEIFQNFVKNGKEGIMLKNRKGTYQQGYRSGDLQKLKGTETVDGFISGFVPSSDDKGNAGLIGGFSISAYVNGVERNIANVSNIDQKTRIDATVNTGGVVSLNPKYLGRVVELTGQEFGKNMKLGSARINLWRPDRNKESCILTLDQIKPKGR